MIYIYTEDINKIVLSNDDDKRIVSSDKITSFRMDMKVRKILIMLRIFKND